MDWMKNGGITQESKLNAQTMMDSISKGINIFSSLQNIKKEKPDANIADYVAEIFDKGSDIIRVIPGYGPVIGTIGKLAGNMYHKISDVFTISQRNKMIKEQNRLGAEESDRINREHEKQMKIDREKEKFRNEQDRLRKINQAEFNKKFFKSIDYELPSNNKNTLMFGKKNQTKDEKVSALQKYVTLTNQGKQREININDLNYIKGQTLENPFDGGKISLHDFVTINPDMAFDYIKHNDLKLEKIPDFKKQYTTVPIEKRNDIDMGKFKDLANSPNYIENINKLSYVPNINFKK
jgi:hypothetical protein